MLSESMNVTMSDNNIVSILVALVFCTALTYFHCLLIVLNFFFFLVWICGIMLGRNTNFSLAQQTLLVPQLPQSSCFIFFAVSEWHQLLLTQRKNPMGRNTTALQNSSRWAGISFAHPALQLSNPEASENIPVPQWHPFHGTTYPSDPPERKDCNDGWTWLEQQHIVLSILKWKPLVDHLQ